MSEIGLIYHDFMSMTWYEYNCIISGYIINSVRQWEHTRMITYYIYAVNTTSKNKMTPAEFMPLLTDKINQPKPKEISPEEKQRLMELAQSRANLIPLNKK